MGQRMKTTTNSLDELAEKFRQACGEVGESEELVLKRLTERLQVSRDTNREFDAGLTFGQRLADRVAAFVGSWVFILIFVGLLILWIALNSFILTRIGKPFDVYPYIFLNLVLSMVAALQAPLIMMSQNRQSAKDRIDAAHDYEVNLKAELEILALHEKIDTLRAKQWMELLAMQHEQIQLLTQLAAGGTEE